MTGPKLSRGVSRLPSPGPSTNCPYGSVDLLAVDEDLLVLHLDGVAGLADHALDEILARVDGVDEDDDVAATRIRELDDALAEDRQPDAVAQLVDQDVVADLQGLEHRARGDLERLHQEGADEERQEERDRERLGILADRGLGLDGRPRHRPRLVVLGLAGDTGTAFRHARHDRGTVGRPPAGGVTLRP